MRFIIFTFFCSIFVSNFSFAETKKEINVENAKLTEKEQKSVDRVVDSYRINTLKKLYEENSKNGEISFSNAYLADKPMTLENIKDLEYPELKIKLSQITSQNRKEILESIKDNLQKEARYQSIFNMGVKYGMHSGLYKAGYDYINYLKNDIHNKMMNNYPLDQLMLANGKILPPVIKKLDYKKEIENKRTIRTIKTRFVIKKQSEVALKPPTYLDFFNNLKISKPTTPQIFLLPINKEELYYWQKGVTNGWIAGYQQAHKIIRRDYFDLAETMLGYITFYALYDRGVVSMPTFKDINVGTNSRGDIVNIGENIFEITQLPQLNDKDQTWLALPQVDDIFNELTKEDVDNLTSELDYINGL